MLPGQADILVALAEALSARGFEGVAPTLQPIEPPRDWGVTSNVCFMLAGRAAQAEIEQRTAGLEKKEAKALAAEITREAGPKLARELAEGLNSILGGTRAHARGNSSETQSVPSSATGDGARATGIVAKVEAEGAYLNFYYDTAALSQQIVREVLAGDYGKGAPTGKRIMVEYAQPNTHKDFHVGHLRNASIGQAIANVLEFEGNEVLKATYIGDVGAHVAKAMFGHHHKDDPNFRSFFPLALSRDRELDPVAYFDACYREANSLIEGRIPRELNTPINLEGYPFVSEADVIRSVAMLKSTVDRLGVQDESTPMLNTYPPILASVLTRKWLENWEQNSKGPERVEWLSSRDEFVSFMKRIFDELEVTFDPGCWFYESTVDDTQLGQNTAQELRERGVAVVDESPEYIGALYVDFPAHAEKFPEQERKRIKQLGKMTILRSDGTSLYQTKELGLAKYKFDNFAIDESLYVVGSEQRLYFEQVFAILALWGFPNAENCRHIAYELVVLPEGKMSSREGTVVSYRELRDEAVRRATEITREKGIVGEGGQVEETAKDIAIAAIKYAMLQVSGNQQIVFDFEQALSFDGRAAPYLQYAYARAGKLVAEPVAVGGTGAIARGNSTNGETVPSSATGGAPVPPSNVPSELHPSETALARTLSLWPQTAKTAAAKYEPAVIANYLYELADAFNAFYRDCRVLDAPEDVKPWRQDLTRAFRAVMQTGFSILALPLPEAM